MQPQDHVNEFIGIPFHQIIELAMQFEMVTGRVCLTLVRY